jgi:hypothetical protein
MGVRNLFRITIRMTALLAMLSMLGQPARAQNRGGDRVQPTEQSDTAMIFTSPRPLLEKDEVAINFFQNTWGLSAFSDYGFGGGLFLGHKFGNELTGLLSFDFGTAKGPKEFGLQTEIKINRIFVLPLILSAQYRLLANVLNENLRPYVTAGAGPVFILTTPGAREFFSAFGDAKIKAIGGGFLGFGANFGIDKHSTFGANLRYYIIPYPAPGLESTQGVFLTDFNGLFLTINYGFNF